MLNLKKKPPRFAGLKKTPYLCTSFETAPRGGAVVARWAHNPKAGGSIPSPATKSNRQMVGCFLCMTGMSYICGESPFGA